MQALTFDQRLQQTGIGTMIHDPIPPHLQPAYAEPGFKAGAFPLAQALHREVSSLPMGPHLNREQQVGRAAVPGPRPGSPPCGSGTSRASTGYPATRRASMT